MLFSQIIKKKVDSYERGRRIPSCQLQVMLNEDQPSGGVHKKVILHGAKKPLNYIIIQSDPLPSGKSYRTRWQGTVYGYNDAMLYITNHDYRIDLNMNLGSSVTMATSISTVHHTEQV